jgi:hypothetical protein
MSLLVESPWPAISAGVLALVLLAIAYANTRRRGLLAAGGGVIALMALLVLLELVVVTEREAVEQTLDSVAAALETNDVDAVMVYLAPDATRIRAAVQGYLPSVTITDAKVGNDLKVTINRLTSPPTARAEFTGRISFDTQAGARSMPYSNLVRKFAIKLQKRHEAWLLSDYETTQPGRGMEPLD